MQRTRKMLSVFMAVVLCVCLSTSALASDSFENIPVVGTASSRAITGAYFGEVTGGNNTQFTIYSPGWSLVGHAEITVVGDPVLVSIKSPNGNSCISGGVVLLYAGQNQRVNLANTVAGDYVVTLQSPTTGNWSYVAVTLKDW